MSKGATHIDWILSTGLFIVSIALAFIFFRPGIAPRISEQSSLDILVDAFNENFVWEVKTTPYFVDECIGFSQGSGSGDDIGTGRVIQSVLSKGNSFMRFITGMQVGGGGGDDECSDGRDNDEDGKVDYPNDIGCINSEDNYEAGDAAETDSILRFYFTSNWSFSKYRYVDLLPNDWFANIYGDSKEFIIHCRNSASNNNEDRIFSIDDDAKFLFTYANYNFKNRLPADIIVECESPQCKFSGRFGSEEEVRGVNGRWLPLFKIGGDGASQWQNPKEVKKAWGFPEEQEFWIQGWKESDQNCGSLDASKCHYIVNYKTANPSEEDDVTVKEVKTSLLYADQTTEDIRIFFRVW